MSKEKLPKAIYTDRYCAFIDFLGFRAVIKSGSLPPAQIDYLMKKARRLSFDDFGRVTQFSDSLILSADATNEWAFLSLIESAFYLSMEMLNEGVLLRGGITRGELYHGEELVFGPAFIRAYDLEQAAGGPRIIVDKNVLSAAKWPDTMMPGEIDSVRRNNIPRDTDGWRYVDYLSPTRIEEFDELDEGYERHLKAVEALIAKHSSSTDPSLISKYGWLQSKLDDAKAKANKH